MQEGTKATYVVGFLGVIATIVGAVIGVSNGKSMEQEKIQQQIYNVLGDNASVTVNDISELLTEYEMLKTENETYKQQNLSYFEELQSKDEKLNSLNDQVGSIPDIQFKDLSLCIDGEDITVNNKQSMAIIDGKEYLSKEIANKFISSDKNITVKDDTLFIGKVIADKTNLINLWNVDNGYVEICDSITDSYGNIHTNAIVLLFNGSYTIYNLDNKFSSFKCKLSVYDGTSPDSTVIVSVEADENIVYTTEINKLSEVFEIDVPINNCKNLKIKINYEKHSRVIISDAIVYN